MTTISKDLRIPKDLLPLDGRFGSGPSRVRDEVLAAACASKLVGTSHRRSGVKDVVFQIRENMKTLFGLPDGYEVVLGVGGTTAFWDVAIFSLIEKSSSHAVFGEFSQKFLLEVKAASFLDEPKISSAAAGSRPDALQPASVDTYALCHNETSTGVWMPVERPAVLPKESNDAIVLVDATSAAGGMHVDPVQFDVYYFAPQKCFGSDAGIWIALCSPKAIERAHNVEPTRHVPSFLSLTQAIEQSRLGQTLNTTAIATLVMLLASTEWMLKGGGLDWAAGRSEASTNLVYEWAANRPFVEPFVVDPSHRSPVVATIDFVGEVNAHDVTRVLRENGIVDTEPYRKLGRNQMRFGLYPQIDLTDTEKLLASIDFVVGALGEN